LPGAGLKSNAPLRRWQGSVYLLDFVNFVRKAQGCDQLEQLPGPGADGSTPLELAMGCRLEPGVMRLASPQAAAAVADATGLRVGADRVTVSLPAELVPHSGAVHASRQDLRHPAVSLRYS
jgi:hypothetical protein